MDIVCQKCRVAQVFAPNTTRLYRGDLLMLVGRMPTQLKAGNAVIRITFPAILD